MKYDIVCVLKYRKNGTSRLDSNQLLIIYPHPFPKMYFAVIWNVKSSSCHANHISVANDSVNMLLSHVYKPSPCTSGVTGKPETHTKTDVFLRILKRSDVTTKWAPWGTVWANRVSRLLVSLRRLKRTKQINHTQSMEGGSVIGRLSVNSSHTGWYPGTKRWQAGLETEQPWRTHSVLLCHNARRTEQGTRCPDAAHVLTVLHTVIFVNIPAEA